MFSSQCCTTALLLSFSVYILFVHGCVYVCVSVWRHVLEAGPHQGSYSWAKPSGSWKLKEGNPPRLLGTHTHTHTCAISIALSLSSWHFINETSSCMFGAYAALLVQHYKFVCECVCVCLRERDISLYHMVIYSAEDLSRGIILPLSPVWVHLWYVERTSAGQGISTGIMCTIIVDCPYLVCRRCAPFPSNTNTSISS